MKRTRQAEKSPKEAMARSGEKALTTKAAVVVNEVMNIDSADRPYASESLKRRDFVRLVEFRDAKKLTDAPARDSRARQWRTRRR